MTLLLKCFITVVNSLPITSFKSSSTQPDVKIDFALERGYVLDRPYHGVYSGSQSGPVNILPSAILSSIFRHFLHQKKTDGCHKNAKSTSAYRSLWAKEHLHLVMEQVASWLCVEVHLVNFGGSGCRHTQKRIRVSVFDPSDRLKTSRLG